jgi:DNA-binding IclR family transcriptional regulator
MKKTFRDPIGRTLEALVWFVESGKAEVGVRELAAEMDMSPSSAHRILLKLLEAGFISQMQESKRYELGMEFFRIAQLSASKVPVRDAALAAMRRLVNKCNETALLGVYDPSRHEMFYPASVESTHPLRYVIELNKWIPVYTGASGLAILAFLSDAEIATIIKRTKLAPLTKLSIAEPESLWAEIARVREAGFALTRGQRIQGAVGIAAPIFNGTGVVTGCICLTIPEQRFDPAGVRGLVEALSECIDEITEKTGGTRRSLRFTEDAMAL